MIFNPYQPLLGLSWKTSYICIYIYIKMSKRISFSTNLAFSNPGIKPLRKKSTFYTTVIGKCCSSQKFLFWELCCQFCLMCQCQQKSCMLFYDSKSTLFSSQMPVMNRYRPKKCLLCISGTLITSVLCMEIFTAISIIPMKENWMNEVRCQKKNAIWIIRWYLTTLWYLVVSCIYWHPVI